jgi:hypothetical protein
MLMLLSMVAVYGIPARAQAAASPSSPSACTIVW